MASLRIIEALPEENIIFPDDLTDEMPDSPFPNFYCLDCQHLDTSLRQVPGEDDLCLHCTQGAEQPNQAQLNTGV